MIKLELKNASFFADMCIGDKAIVDKFNQLEAYVIGKPCQNFIDFVNGLYDYFLQYNNHREDVEIGQEEKQTSIETEKMSQQEELRLAEEKVSLLQSQLDNCQDIISRLESENESQKQSLLSKQSTIEVLINSMIEEYEYLETAKIREKPSDTIIKHQEEKIDSMLVLMGVQSMNDIGTQFDSQYQYAEEIESTDDKTKDNTIAESISMGFRTKNYCIKPQSVVVYKYKE